MKKFLTAAIFASLLPIPGFAQEMTIKMGHAASSKHVFQEGLEMFAKKVGDKTGGQIKIEVYGDRQLGDDKQLLEGLQIGLINGALVSSPTLPLVIGAGSFDALQLPFTVSSYEQLSTLLTSDLGDELLATLDSKSIKGLGFVEAGLRHYLSATKAVTSTADFAGLKTRIVPIPLHKATFEAIGVNPIGMAYGEVYSALETKTIDGVEINLSSIQSESLYDAAKNVTLTGHYFWPGVVMLSQATWEKLPDDQKKAMVEAGHETTREAYALAASQEADTITFLKEKGVTIDNLSDLDKMRALTAPVADKWKAQDPLIAKIADRLASGN
jgi:tripartite ATP-independent transporter DctP family solute receptor